MSALCTQYFLFVAFLFILWYLTFKSLIHILNSTQVHYPNAPERSVKLKNEKQTNPPFSRAAGARQTLCQILWTAWQCIFRGEGEADTRRVKHKTRILKKVSSLPNLLLLYMIISLNCGFQISVWGLGCCYKLFTWELAAVVSFSPTRNLNSWRTGSSFCCVDLIIIVWN